MITTLEEGFFTTVQDEGRSGYQAYGLPDGGVMDHYASRVANLLVGNSRNAAVIEMTQTGAAFKFDEEQLVAVCGADMQGTVNEIPLINWSSFIVPRRGELKFQAAASGYRTYIAVRGGFNVPWVLGSRSTYCPARIGGFEGRTLQQGDVLHVGSDLETAAGPQLLPLKYIPRYEAHRQLRILLGPQDHLFSPEALQLFFSSTYRVGSQADRMAYALQGPRIPAIGKADIISEAASRGAVQVPANGLPVIMMADHQTTSGFAKLGFIIRADLLFLTQSPPGSTFTFRPCAEGEALDALRRENRQYSEIKIQLGNR